MDSILVCDGCNNEYNTSNRKPKFLTCFHTFCLRCLEERTNAGVIKCPACPEIMVIDSQLVEQALQTNFHIFNLLQDAIQPKFNENLVKGTNQNSFYWCDECKSILKNNEPCTTNCHAIRPIKNEDDRKAAEDNLKKVLSTYKIHLNGSVKNFQKVESCLKTALAAVKALEQHVNIHLKDNAREMKETVEDLKEINQKMVEMESKIFSTEEMYNDCLKYSELIIESNDKVKNTTNYVAAIESVREAGMSMKVKTRAGNHLSVPMFKKTRLDFYSPKVNQLDSHILTLITYMILLSTLNEPVSVQTTTLPIKTNRNQVNQVKVDSNGKFNKVEVDEVYPMMQTKVLNARGSEFLPHSSSQMTRLSRRLHNTKFTENATPEIDHEDQEENLYEGASGYSREDPVDSKSIHSSIDSDYYSKIHRFNSFPARRNQRFDPYQPPIDFTSTSYTSNGIPPTMSTVHELHHIYHDHFLHPNAPSISFRNPEVFISFAINGLPFGTASIRIRPDVAPIMCHTFLDACHAPGGYAGTRIYKVKPSSYVMGGKIQSSSTEYKADPSPLKKTRGAIFMRLKRDFLKEQCSIVSTEFCINLGEQREDFKTSTVFGHVITGFDVLENISYMDCYNSHISVESLEVV